MAIRILAVGKRHESWVQSGIERYEKRLNRPLDIEWVLLPHSAREGDTARQEESERLLERITPREFVLLLDERGKQLDSPAFSRVLFAPLEIAKKVTIVIGGAYGVDKRLHERADFTLSLSPMVYPHQLVRLIIIEQIYRAQEIATARPYHHS